MNQAKLLKLDDYIEEEVILDINGLQFVAFASICPYEIVVNKIYPVELSLTMLDDIEFYELDKPRYGLEKIDHAYAYMVYGRVCGDSIDIGNGIKIQDDMFDEYTYLDGKYIKIKIDRLEVEFLEALH